MHAPAVVSLRNTVFACCWHVTALSGRLLRKLIADTSLVEEQLDDQQPGPQLHMIGSDTCLRPSGRDAESCNLHTSHCISVSAVFE